MLRRSVILGVLVALCFPALAAAQAVTTELMPGVTYTREVRWVRGGPLVVHSIVAPKPGGAYALEPVLSNQLVLGRERVSSMQRRLSGQATLAGINGDLFNWNTGHPSGILFRDGVLENRPIGSRSSLGIGLDGILRVGRIDFFGSWAVGDGERYPLAQFNRPLGDEEGVALYTPLWGGKTPRAEHAVDIVLSGFPAAAPNTDLIAQIAAVRMGGGTPVPAGGAVLQATGVWAEKALIEAAPGLPLAVKLILRPWWSDVSGAIGGGPDLVRDGRPVYRTTEDFLSSQLVPRHPRTAIGQLADGRILLVAVDGRARWSTGVRTWELALEMTRLGAVTGMALDAGGSTTIAFDGRVLNRPSDGAERPVGDALMVFYYGVFAPDPRYGVVSPNGDGLAERQRLAYKVVRPSTVDVKLVAPDDSVVWADSGAREPGVYPVNPDPAQTLQQQGKYRWVVSAVDDQGQQTEASRSFSVNNTLGFLDLSSRRLRVTPKRGGKLTARFKLAAPARLIVTVDDANGKPVRTLYTARKNEPGPFVLTWDGRARGGRAVRTGTYVVRVRAINQYGLVTLERKLTVRQTRRG